MDSNNYKPYKDHKKNKEKLRGNILNRKLKLYNKIDKYKGKITPLEKIKKTLQLKYGVINSSTEEKNRVAAVKTIFNITVISGILIIIDFTIIKVWYLAMLLAIGIIIFPYTIFFPILNLRLSKLNKQFPDAVNIFITKYTSNKNKDKALQRTYKELEYPIRYEFMRLSKMVANKRNIIGAIKSFCRRVDYVWAESFGELLILNHTTVDDIGDELNELGILMAEDQALEAHKQAEIGETKSVNFFVAGFVLAAPIMNLAIFKEEAIKIYL